MLINKSNSLARLRVFLSVALLLTGCNGFADSDNDGVNDFTDIAPNDPACSKFNEDNCGQCGLKCASDHYCKFNSNDGECLPRPSEICDGLDNDFDDVVDNIKEAEKNEKQLGVCFGSTKSCDGVNGSTDDYSKVLGYEIEELSCDGLDNDCDGMADENLETMRASGVCREIFLVCQGYDGWVSPNFADLEIERYEIDEISCDGLDNDCDGVVDEKIVSTETLSSNQEGVCKGAFKTCQNGTFVDIFENVSNYENEESICDGLDNDCDGLLDENASTDLATNQQGVCQGSKKICEDGHQVEPNQNLLGGC